MAQITWRNVDAPNFGDSNDLLRTSAFAFNKAFESAREGINGFMDATGKEQSNILMQNVAKAQAAGTLKADLASGAAFAGTNPAYLTPESIKYGQNQVTAQLNNDEQSLKNAQSQKMDPLLLTQQGLVNQSKDINNKTSSFALDVQKQERDVILDRRAALPGWNTLNAQIEAKMGSGDPLQIAEAKSLMGSKEFTDGAARMGINAEGIIAGYANIGGKVAAGVTNAAAVTGIEDAAKARGLNLQSIDIYNQATKANSIEEATKNINSSALPADQKVAALKKLSEQKDILFPAVDPAAALADTQAAKIAKNYERNPLAQPGANLEDAQAFRGAGRIIMANQGAGRGDDLSPTLKRTLGPILEDMDLSWKVNSGGIDVDHPNKALTKSGRHVDGGAGDGAVFYKGRQLDPDKASDIPILQELSRRAFEAGVTGIGAGPGYMGGKSLHIGFGKSGVWGSSGYGTAYKWLQEAYNSRATKTDGTFKFDPGGPGTKMDPATAQARKLQVAAQTSAELTNGKSTTGKFGNEAPSALDPIVTNQGTGPTGGKAYSTNPDDPETLFQAAVLLGNQASAVATHNQLDSSSLDVYGGFTFALFLHKGFSKSTINIQ